jgi:caffeoyl-CoA O-methyltransferase
MERNLEKYLRDHSTPEDPVLEDLYRQTHIRFVNPNMITGHIQGLLLGLISRMINPAAILEIGTFTAGSSQLNSMTNLAGSATPISGKPEQKTL